MKPAPVLDDGQPGSRIMGETGGAGGGDGDCFTLVLRRARQLTALRLGEERAMSFGIDVRRLRLGSLLRISLLAALSVAFVGPIGFIGLVAPHISRLLLGKIIALFARKHPYRWAGAIAGLGSVEEHHSRCHFTVEFTSLVGVPFFLSIVMRHRGVCHERAYD